MTPEKFAALVLVRFGALISALVASSWPGVTRWWRDLYDAFMRSGRRQLVARVGRRGFKSSTACIFAVAFALVYSTLGLVPPGDIGWVVFVSVTKEEALSRLRTVARILDAIGVAYEPSGDTIVLAGTNIGFRVQACTVASVSGWTSILIIADEVSKWMDRDSGSNPATEVLAALRPTMSTQPLARILLLSSPLSTLDAHAKAFEAGDSEFQMIAHAATWVASEGAVPEEETRKLERDPRIWSREYEAIPQAAALAAFDPDAIERAFRARPHVPGERPVARTLIVDPSSGRKDSWTWAVISRIHTDLPGWRDYFYVDPIGAVEGRFFEQTSAEDVVSRIAAVAREYGLQVVHGDQRESFSLVSLFRTHGIRYVVHDWTSTSKPDAVARVRRWFADGTIQIREHDRMRRELLSFEEKITPSGSFTFGARGSGHDDFVSLLLTSAMAEIAGGLREPKTAAPAPPPLEIRASRSGEVIRAGDFFGDASPSGCTSRPDLAQRLAAGMGSLVMQPRAVAPAPSPAVSPTMPNATTSLRQLAEQLASHLKI